MVSDVRFYLTHKVLLTEAQGCCTPAVLYRVKRIPTILEAIKNYKNDTRPQKDLVLDAVAEEKGFVARQSDINLVVHIGYVSSLSNVYKNVGN